MAKKRTRAHQKSTFLISILSITENKIASFRHLRILSKNLISFRPFFHKFVRFIHTSFDSRARKSSIQSLCVVQTIFVVHFVCIFCSFFSAVRSDIFFFFARVSKLLHNRNAIVINKNANTKSAHFWRIRRNRNKYRNRNGKDRRKKNRKNYSSSCWWHSVNVVILCTHEFQSFFFFLSSNSILDAVVQRMAQRSQSKQRWIRYYCATIITHRKWHCAMSKTDFWWLARMSFNCQQFNANDTRDIIFYSFRRFCSSLIQLLSVAHISMFKMFSSIHFCSFTIFVSFRLCNCKLLQISRQNKKKN